MVDTIATLQKHLTDVQEETLEFFNSLLYADTMEEKVAEAKLINQTLAEKQKWIFAAFNRIKQVSDNLYKIKKLRQDRNEIVKLKEEKIMKLIKIK